MFLVSRDIFTHDNSPSTAARRNFYNNTDVWKSKYLLCRTKFYRPVGQWNLKFHFRYINQIILMLEIPYGTCYSKTKEEQLPTSGCPHKQWLEKSTLVTRSKLGWFFYALKHYLINVNTNVSNARMNRPKVMRSLKSNLLFISTTPILCKIK